MSVSMGRDVVLGDVDAVAACLTSAFHDDPIWGTWMFPQEAGRAQQLYPLMRFFALAYARHSWGRMSERAETVALWLRPGDVEMTAEEEAAFGPLVDETFGPRAEEAHALFDLFEEHHPDAEPHYYLSLWATHRDHVGRGLGTRLILEDLARIDAERMPAYLESTNPANLARYEALGFRARSEFGPDGGPVITTMWRKAR
jgi:GNAT superfamily N-acetyltransferase